MALDELDERVITGHLERISCEAHARRSLEVCCVPARPIEELDELLKHGLGRLAGNRPPLACQETPVWIGGELDAAFDHARVERSGSEQWMAWLGPE